jgi:hypothetical protein
MIVSAREGSLATSVGYFPKADGRMPKAEQRQ